jgi:hypothetical protein
VKGSVIPFHCLADIGPHHLPGLDSEEQPPKESSAAGALLRQRCRTAASRHSLTAVLLTHLREARQPWRHNQDRAYVSCPLTLSSSGSDEGEPLQLEAYAAALEPEWRVEEGWRAVGFVPRALFNLQTTHARGACFSVWSSDARLGGLVRHCRLGERALLLRNAAADNLALLDAESERDAVIRLLDPAQSSMFACLLKLNRLV